MDKNMASPPPPGFVPPGAYPPQAPPPYYPGQPQPVPEQNIVVIGTPAFGSESQRLTCPHCRSNISTTVENEANMKTHLFALLLCAFGLFCFAPCPYCIDTCLTKKHYCPSCGTFLGQSEN